MPVAHDHRGLPAWSELDTYEIVRIVPGPARTWVTEHPANKIVVVDGDVTVHFDGLDRELEAGAVLDLPSGSDPVRIETEGGARVALVGGHWGSETGGSGVFHVAEVSEGDEPRNGGDPVDYGRRTNFDNHFHDSDEYWIIVDGRGTAVSEGVHYEFGPGDCVATRMGDHHDLPLAPEPVRGVYFETTLLGQRRLGHLWDHTHGPAIPAAQEAASTR